MLQMILCILSTTCRNETHARLFAYLAVRLSVSLCLSVSQSVSHSVSQSVFLFIRTCQLEELWTTFCDILYIPYVSGDEFSLVVFSFLQ
jgi:hypothetical protein